MKFELQYEWTPPQIFFYGYCLITILSACRWSPWYQVQSKTAGTEILLISERLESNFTRGSHRRSSIKKMFLKISQYSQENTCARVSFSLKLQASGLKLYLKRDSSTGVFLWIFQNFQKHFFSRTPMDECFYFKTVAGFTLCKYV